jgi:cellulose synthase/poly-beta-1,6-N-acetylglucosamine synthase-like glycosyltransferase
MKSLACGACAIIPLPRLFTVEYASQFDVLLPGFAAMKLPILLGGSSNHFVTAALREIGAWDPSVQRSSGTPSPRH